MNLSALLLIPMLLAASLVHGEMSQQELREILGPRIEGMKHVGTTGILVDAVKAQNSQLLSPEEILSIDADWKAGNSPKISEIQHTRASKYLKSLIRRMSNTYSEAYIVDKRGANVAMYPDTSDYWQGDEDSFLQAYADGKGAVYVATPHHDESTDADEVKVSVPMLDGDEVIGVLFMGVKVSAVEAQKIRNLKAK
ncbi:MAG: hypothetical protein VYA55_18660 [Pseudomonadota bacterium]|nr:hypothetical protein [Pseudomonadota bacterium]